MVNVYENGKIIADVDYNNNLDVWNGQNWQSGGPGNHRGLTRLEDGRFVLIHGSDWQGVEDYAEIITPEEALQEILKSSLNLLDQEILKSSLDLLDEFDLRDDYEQKLVKEKKSWSTKSIKVNEETYDKLTSFKKGNDTYNDVISRMIDENETLKRETLKRRLDKGRK